mgnify:FL=1
MTIFLKAYGVTLLISIISYTMYLLIKNKPSIFRWGENDTESTENGNREGENITDGFPLLLAGVYYLGEGLDKIIFNGGVHPREEIFNREIEQIEETISNITPVEEQEIVEEINAAREWGILRFPGLDDK